MTHPHNFRDRSCTLLKIYHAINHHKSKIHHHQAIHNRFIMPYIITTKMGKEEGQTRSFITLDDALPDPGRGVGVESRKDA